MATGCSTTAKLAAPRRPILDVPTIQRLVILEFDGPHDSGQIAQGALTSQLSANDSYRLVSQAELDRLAPVSAPDYPPDIQAALHAARQLGVDAVLTGRVVNYGVCDDVTEVERKEQLTEDDPIVDAVLHSVGVGVSVDTHLDREATVSLAFQLLDVKTGEVIAARQTHHSFNAHQVNGDGALPAREQILTELMHECARDVVEMIAPHDTTVEAPLVGMWWWEGGSGGISQGNKLAKAGDWNGAALRYEEVLRDHPENHAAMHNLAVSYEARGDYHTAEAQINSALDVARKSEYLDAAMRVEMAKAGQTHRMATKPTIR